MSSSTIDKMFEITLFTRIGTKCTLLTKKVRNFRKNVNFVPNFVPNFVKSVNFVNGR